MSPTQRLLPDNTQSPQEADIYVPGGIRTRHPSTQADADPRLRPLGQRDQQYLALLLHNKSSFTIWVRSPQSNILIEYLH